jgi:DNA-binding transcriptional LysR family regulator
VNRVRSRVDRSIANRPSNAGRLDSRDFVLFELARKHPQLQIDISFTDRAVDLIEEGFDLAVRIGDLQDSTSLAARRLGVQHMSIGAAPSYLAKYGMPVDLDNLRGHAGIAYSRGGVLTPWRVQDGEGQPQELRIAPQLSLDDVQAIAGAGIAGFGLVQLPRWLLTRYAQTGELAFVRERCGVGAQDIHAVWPKTRYLPLKTRCAIDALVAAIPDMIRA